MYQKIVLAGGNGYLGKVLTDFYKDKAKEIIILSRQQHPDFENVRYQVWDGKTAGPWTQALENSDLLVNLCGKNVNCRYTAENQKEIIQSRTVPTALLGAVINSLQQPPKVWINITSATIYRHAEDRCQDEENGDIGTGFSINVCRAWEKTFWEAATPKTKKMVLRLGIVLGRADGVFPRLKNLVKFGLGGKQGAGNQYVSWIHEHDFARSIDWMAQNAADGAVVNGTAPEAIKNKDLMALIRKTYGMPVGLPAPQWLLEIGALVIGTETELILKSRWVYPQKLLQSGFTFQFPKAEHAVKEIMSCRA